jgi:phosphoglycolate phosphatase-like HAD superfamily hydrolase
MSNKLFVWDFHGVLEKDNEKAVIEISNQVLADSGYAERFTEEDNEKFYGLKWYQYFEQLLPRLTSEECLGLQAKCFELAEKRLDILAKYIKPNDYVIDVLAAIAARKQQQIVVSNSRQADLIWFLKSIGIDGFFDDKHVLGINAHQKHSSKRDALEAYLQGKHFDQIVVIGDSVADMQLGKAVGGTTYYYKHPHRIHDDTKHADHTINDLREVLHELDKA